MSALGRGARARIASPRFAVIAVCSVLAILCLLIHAPGLPNEFVWDDELYITRNPEVAAGLTAQGLRWAVTTFHAGNWHPLTWISLQADAALFGLEPSCYHLTTLLLHVANAMLLFLVLRRMTGALWRSALVAALFAVHPLHVESVAWAAERKDVLSTCLWLLALLTWLGRLRRPGTGRYLAAAACFALALMAKPMPVTLPFLLLLLDWWPLGRFVSGPRVAVIAEKLPLVALSAISAAVTWFAQTSAGAVGSVPLDIRLTNAALSYCRYLLKTLWPARLALLYPFPEAPPSPAATTLAVAALAAITVLVLLARRRSPALPVGWLWFLGTLVPVIGLVQVGTQSMADRYTYVPLTGVFVMGVWGLGDVARRRRLQATWFAAASAIALLTVSARAQVRTWRDPPAAFGNALLVTRDNATAHALLAAYSYERGDDRAAEEHSRAAIAIAPDHVGAHSTLALVLERTGRIGAAIAEYRAAIRAAPRLAEAHHNLGVLLAVAGETDEAELHLRQALTIRPEFASAHSNLGKLLARRGRLEEALPHFREAVRLAPGTALHLGDLGAALAALGRFEEAIPALRAALLLDPGLESARGNLALALSRQSHRR